MYNYMYYCMEPPSTGCQQITHTHKNHANVLVSEELISFCVLSGAEIIVSFRAECVQWGGGGGGWGRRGDGRW